MKKQTCHLSEMILIGKTIRTNNKYELNPKLAKIPALVQSYFKGSLASNIQYRSTPGVTYSVYTDYASDVDGDYSYFIGEQVTSLENLDHSQFSSLQIEKNCYQKFTTQAGPMPNIIISAWQAIWQMSELELNGKRNYQADFEVYDQRATDPKNSVIDIYIGIEPIEN